MFSWKGLHYIMKTLYENFKALIRKRWKARISLGDNGAVIQVTLLAEGTLKILRIYMWAF